MRTSSLLLGACLLAFVLSAACGGDDRGTGGTGPPLPVSTITIHGVVRLETDSAPVAGAVLRAYQVMPAGKPDIELASVTTAPNGAYSISFAAPCESFWPYVLILDYPHHYVTRCTCPNPSCNLVPLPQEACTSGDWPVDIWVLPGE